MKPDGSEGMGCSLRLLLGGSNPIAQMRSERWTKIIRVGGVTAEDVHGVRRLRTAVSSYEEEILGERTKLDALQLLMKFQKKGVHSRSSKS